jgi:hypothetical protein
VRGYYVKYDNGQVFSYFSVNRKQQWAKALHLADTLRDEMNEREDAKQKIDQ